MFFPLPACSAPRAPRDFLCSSFFFLFSADFSPAFSLLLFLSLPSRSTRFLPLRAIPKGGGEVSSGIPRDEAPGRGEKTDQKAEPFKLSPMSSGRPNIRFMFCTA